MLLTGFANTEENKNRLQAGKSAYTLNSHLAHDENQGYR
jgi:hypothetical protein